MKSRSASAKTTGWYTFLYADLPIGWTWDLDERLGVIDTDLPAHERATRRRCIVAVEEALIPPAYVEARRACAEAWRAYVEAWWAYAEAAERGAYVEAWRAYAAAERAYAEAVRAYVAARRAAAEPLLALALRLVPDAPWDAQRQELVFP